MEYLTKPPYLALAPFRQKPREIHVRQAMRAGHKVEVCSIPAAIRHVQGRYYTGRVQRARQRLHRRGRASRVAAAALAAFPIGAEPRKSTVGGYWKDEGCVEAPRLSARMFTELHPGVRDVLRPETNRASGAFARERRCPNCAQAMVPLRLDSLLAWLNWCEPCELLWVEKLDVSVIVGLKSRLARARAAASLPEDERRQVATDIARESREHQRDLRITRTIESLLWALQSGI